MMKLPPLVFVHSVLLLAILVVACLPVRKQTVITGITVSFFGLLLDAISFLSTPKKRRTFNLFTIVRIYVWLVMGGSFTFLLMYLDDESSFNGTIHKDSLVLDFNYFTVTTFSTVGYGDITAATPLSRTIVSLFILLTMFINIVVINLFISYVRFKPDIVKLS